MAPENMDRPLRRREVVALDNLTLAVSNREFVMLSGVE